MYSIKRWTILALCAMVIISTGCGLAAIPEDCVVFERADARAWVVLAQADKADGDGEVEVFANVLRECVESYCDGQSGGVCAVSCTACTDAIVNVTFD